MKTNIIILMLCVFAACKNQTTPTETGTGAATATTNQPSTAAATATPLSTGNSPAQGYYKHLQGKIGEAEVQMDLIKTGNKLYGTYSYVKVGELIDLNSPDNQANIDEQGNFTLSEFANTRKDGYSQTGSLKGQILPNGTAVGAWSSPDAKKVLNFTLTTVPLSGSANLSMVNIQKQEGNCQSEEPCAHIEITYPILTKLPNDDARALNDMNVVIAKALSESMPTEEPTPPEEAVIQFIKNFKEQDNSFKMSWEHEVTTNIFHNANHILSLGFSTYSFTGGAHPNHAESFYNFNLKTGKEIELADVFQPGYEKSLTALVEQKLRKLYSIGPKTPLTEAGFFEDKFVLNDNFSITKTGVNFLFNPYEIAPYAMGEQFIYLPFAEIKQLLKPNGVVNW